MLKLLLLLSFAISCGADEPQKEYIPVYPTPGNGSNDGGGSNGGGGNGGGSSGGGSSTPSYAETQALLLTFCESCHASANFLASERGLKSSSSLNRIRSRSMPPANANRKLPDRERSAILSFF